MSKNQGHSVELERSSVLTSRTDGRAVIPTFRRISESGQRKAGGSIPADIDLNKVPTFRRISESGQRKAGGPNPANIDFGKTSHPGSRGEKRLRVVSIALNLRATEPGLRGKSLLF